MLKTFKRRKLEQNFKNTNNVFDNNIAVCLTKNYKPELYALSLIPCMICCI